MPLDTLISEELSKRIDDLSFDFLPQPITPEHWAYRECAAVRVDYELDELEPPNLDPSPAVAEGIRMLLAESLLTYQDEDNPLYRLNHQVRNQTLRRLAAEKRLVATLEANTAHHSSILQKMLELYIRGKAPALKDQNLEQIEATLQVIDWLAGCLPDLPPQDQVKQRLNQERLLKDFRFLVGKHFRNREEELKILRAYVGVLVDDRPTELPADPSRGNEPPLLLYGPGGIGKSSLIAKFILEHAELDDDRRFPYAYLDFNRRDIDIKNPVSILLEAAQQLDIQYPSQENRWERLQQEWQFRLEEYRYSEDKRASEWEAKQQFRFASHSQREWERYRYEFMNTLFSLLNDPGKPFLLIFDTIEELLYHNISYLENLWHFLTELQQQFPQVRLVFSGRSPLPEAYPTQEKLLDGLDRPSARQTLLDRGIPDKAAFADQIIDIVGCNPFSLWLAADLYHRLQGDLSGFKLEDRQEYFHHVKEYLLQGQLYRRILGHIKDKDLRALAHPGMVLRRITPEIILKVLAEPCQIDVKNLTDAQELFNKLKQEYSIIEIKRARPDELCQRPELRLAMLELLRQDRPETARKIHQMAVAFFQQRLREQSPPDARDQADEVYHRLALEEEPDFLNNFSPEQLQSIADELGNAIEDLPVRAQTFLISRSKVKIKIDDRVWAEADLKDWEHKTSRTVQSLLSLGRFAEARQQLEERQERSFGSLLYALHVQTLISLGLLDPALEILAEGLRRSAPNTLEMQELLFLKASLEEEKDNFPEALKSYRRARAIAENRSDHISCLSTQVNIFRLVRTLFPLGASEINQEQKFLLEDWEKISDEELFHNPTLLRNVATQVGPDSQEVVKRAVRLVGLGEKPTNLEPLAGTLASWDAAMGEDQGVLARAVKAECLANLYETWLAYLMKTPWREVSARLTSLLDAHTLSPAMSIALVELIKARLLLTTEQAGLLQSILSNAYTPDELQLLMSEQFGISLAEVIHSSDSSRQAADLVSWVESKGYTLQLLQALVRARPDHPQLISLLKSLGIDFEVPAQVYSRMAESLKSFSTLTGPVNISRHDSLSQLPEVGKSIQSMLDLVNPDSKPAEWYVLQSVLFSIQNAQFLTQLEEVASREDFIGKSSELIQKLEIIKQEEVLNVIYRYLNEGIKNKLKESISESGPARGGQLQKKFFEYSTFAVARGELSQKSGPRYFTAFLVGPDLVMTQHQAVADVISGGLPPENLTFRFDLITTKSGEILSQGQAYTLALGPEAQAHFRSKKPWLVAAEDSLGYALLRLARPAGQEVVGGLRQGPTRGWLTLGEDYLKKSAVLGTIFFRHGLSLTVVSQNNAFLGYFSKNWQKLKYQLEMESGASGAPILAPTQVVVGIHTSTNTDGTSEGVSLPAVVRALRRQKLWPLNPPRISRLRRLIKLLLKFALGGLALWGILELMVYLGWNKKLIYVIHDLVGNVLNIYRGLVP